MKSKQQEEFDEMVRDGIDSLIYQQSDETEPPSARFVAMDDAMVKPYEFVDKPKHYVLCGSETMPMIEQILGTEGYLAFLKGSALKYRFRASKKPGSSVEQDIAKAMYMEKLYNDFVRENTPS